MNQEMKEQPLTKRPIDLLFQLSIPAVIGMIVIGLYPLMDGIFAGKIIGQRAMTACGVAMPLTFFNSGVSTLLGVGSASVLSRAIGKGKKAGVIVMLRQLSLFIPAMILLPMAFGVKAVWFTQPLVDFIMIVVGIAMMINELKNMGQVKSDTK